MKFNIVSKYSKFNWRIKLGYIGGKIFQTDPAANPSHPTTFFLIDQLDWSSSKLQYDPLKISC